MIKHPIGIMFSSDGLVKFFENSSVGTINYPNDLKVYPRKYIYKNGSWEVRERWSEFIEYRNNFNYNLNEHPHTYDEWIKEN